MIDKLGIEKNEIFMKAIRSKIEQWAHFIQKSDMKEYIQMLVIEPFLGYIVRRIFPYMIIALCLFGIIFIFVIIIFVILIRQHRHIQCTICGK